MDWHVALVLDLGVKGWADTAHPCDGLPAHVGNRLRNPSRRWRIGTALGVLFVVSVAWGADGPFLLPPGTTAGSETSAGAIPDAAANMGGPTGVERTETKSGGGAMRARIAVSSAGSDAANRKVNLWVEVAGFPALAHVESYDRKGVLTFANTFRSHGAGQEFYEPVFLSPGTELQTGPKSNHRIMYLRYITGATASGDSQGQCLLLMEVIPKLPFDPKTDKPVARLSIRMVGGKDGWSRMLMRVEEGQSFSRLAIKHCPPEAAIIGRSEALWVAGKQVETLAGGKPVGFGRGDPLSLDPKLPGVIWYGTGKTGANIAAYGVLSSDSYTAVSTGDWSGGPPLVGGASVGNEVRFMVKETAAFGEPAEEQAAFAKQLPALHKDLDATVFALPPTAEGLALAPALRDFMERLIGDAPKLVNAKGAADKLGAALKDYEKSLAKFLSVKAGEKRLEAEEELARLRGQLDIAIEPLAKLWTDVGGVPAAAEKKPASKPVAAKTAEPADERYDLSPPAYGPDSIRWYGDKPVSGRMSVLVLYGAPDFWEQHGRKLAELKRALDLDMEYAMSYESNTLGSRIDEQRIRSLLASRHWDVILDWNVQPFHGTSDNIGIMPVDVRAQIYRAVMDEGTGLLLLSSKTAQEFCRKDRRQPSDGAATFAGLTLTGRVPRQENATGKQPPLEAEQQFANAYFTPFKAGKGNVLGVETRIGRAVSVASGPGNLAVCELQPWGVGNRVDGDYFHAEMGRLLWRAAGRQPAVGFVKAPPLIISAVGGTAALKESWRILANAEVKELKATARLRGLDGKVLAEQVLPLTLTGGEAEIPLVLPALGAGSWYVDLFLDSPRGRENFGYAAILVPETSAVTLKLEPQAPPATDTDYLSQGIKPGDPITGTATVAAATTGPAVTQLRVSLIDEFDRVLAVQTAPTTPGANVPFSFATADIERIPLRIQAQALSADGTVLGSGMQEFCLMHTRRDRFQVALAGMPSGPWWLWTLRDLWRQGVTMVSEGGTGSRANLGAHLFSGMGVLRGDFRGKPLGESIPVSKLTMYYMEWDEASGRRKLLPEPWNDPKAFEEVLDLTQHVWDRICRFPTPVAVLYDEGSNIAADTSLPGMKAWADWLKADYKGDITALNREWGNSYKGFEDITEVSGQHDKKMKGDPFEHTAMLKGNIARWVDRRIFANQNYANLVLDGWTRRARKTDPDARLGLSGTFRFHNFGTDYDVWLKKSGFWNTYSAPRGEGLVMDLIRSNCPKNYLYGYWIGYNNGTQLPMVWDMVFKGATAVWHFQLCGDGVYGWFGRNDVPYGVRQTMIDQAILPLRRGLGDLLMRLDQQNDPIAIYYSAAIALVSGSTFIPEMKGPAIGKEFAAADASASGAIDLVMDSGRSFHYLTKQRVLDGDLEKLGIKLLLLPMAQPLGDDEVAALRAFAEAGGVIVADLRPGVLSGHGRAVAAGPADALFGVKRSGPGKAQAVALTAPSQVNGQAVPFQFDRAIADAELTLAGAKAAATAGEVPLLLENRVGKGSAWLLNVGFDQYTPNRTSTAGEGWRALAAALWAQAGVPRPAGLLNTAAGKNPLARLRVWERGGVRLYGVLDGEGSGDLNLPAEAHLFDLRKGSLGKTDKAPIALFGADTAHFIAAYAYDPGRPAVVVGKPEGGVVACAIRMSGVPADETGTFSYHTRLLDPKGEWVDVIPWSVQGAGGNAVLRIRFAENDPAGQWNLVVREVTTGRESVAEIVWP